MANLFSFGTYGAILGHAFKFHIESNTLFHWFEYMFEYDEEENGIRIVLEFCKIQMFLAISSNIQDVYNYTSSSYFLRQEHIKDPSEKDLENFGKLPEIEDEYN